VRVLKAVSSSLRMTILDLLLERGPLSYTELMNTLRLNPNRDAGRFAYHLKLLLKEDLVEPDVKAKKYHITDLGRMVMDVTEDIEERVSRRRLMVRTSRLAMEEFDRNKIADSLVREAGVPVDQAQKIARETERRLLGFETKYLTAPLIRELVNAVLIEKGLEEYRHKLTRLGLPVYDVTQLVKSTGEKALNVEAVHRAAGDAVMEEYALLNVLPRDIADAHLSGALHINHLGCWILKPHELVHDLRFFLKWGLNLGETGSTGLSYPPPKSFEAALLMASNILRIAATEASGEQALDFLNIFLAPFAQGLPTDRVEEGLRSFVHDVNQSFSRRGSPVEVSLGLELVTPSFLEDGEAAGPGGKSVGSYKDFVEESRLIASLLLEVMHKGVGQRPVFNPSLVVKIRPEALGSKECEPLLFESHRLAAETGTPYFANLCFKGQEGAAYTATGSRFPSDWTEDPELDALRTGTIGSVVLNLPRVSYDAEGQRNLFFSLLDERLEMALRALEIKYRTIKQRAVEGLLPFLTQKGDGDQYFRLENASRPVSFVGLNEAVKALSGQSVHEDRRALSLAEEIAGHLLRHVQRYTKKPESRVYPSLSPNVDAAKRLAELDAEKYGWGRVSTQGSKEHPFYTDLVAAPLETDIPWMERLNIEEKLHKLTPGGHLAIAQLADSEQDPRELLSATRRLLEKYRVGLYAYNRNLVHCSRCQKTFHGILSKCPLCGSVDALVGFSRVSAKYLPIPRWTPAKRLALNRRASYTLAAD